MPSTFPSDSNRGLPAWLNKATQTIFRTRYRTSVGDSNAANKTPVIIQGAPSQTADLLAIYDSSKNLLWYVAADGSGPSPQYATTTLTSTQILALFTTAIPLVPAPGANKVIEFVRATITYNHVATDYTINGSTNLSVKYKDKGGVDVSTTRATTGFIDQATAQYSMFQPLTAQLVLDTNAINQPLCLALATANPTVGDGTLKVNVVYRVHTL